MLSGKAFVLLACGRPAELKGLSNKADLWQGCQVALAKVRGFMEPPVPGPEAQGNQAASEPGVRDKLLLLARGNSFKGSSASLEDRVLQVSPPLVSRSEGNRSRI